MDVGASVHAGDLKLPRGVTLATESQALVLHVISAPTAEQMEADIGAPAGGPPGGGAGPGAGRRAKSLPPR